MTFHNIFSVKSLTFVPFRSIAMYYWHFIISYRDEQNFSACYCTVSPLGNIGKNFNIIIQKVIFPISQILSCHCCCCCSRCVCFHLAPTVVAFAAGITAVVDAVAAVMGAPTIDDFAAAARLLLLLPSVVLLLLSLSLYVQFKTVLRKSAKLKGKKEKK